jgi:hypothetical protein
MNRKIIILSSIVIIVAALALVVAANSLSKPSPEAPITTPNASPSPTEAPITNLTVAESAIVNVNPLSQQISSSMIGQDIQVNITISNVQNLWGWNLVNISFNPNVLNLTGIREGPFLQQAGPTIFLWPSGAPEIKRGILPEVNSQLLSFSGVNGSGLIATINFQVLSAGNSQISINQTSLFTPVAIRTGVHQSITGTKTFNGNVTVLASNSP